MQQYYQITCYACHTRINDDASILDCPEEHNPSLLLTDYDRKQFEVDEKSPGIFRYRNWLPITHILPNTGRTITYRSENLCRRTGLPNLWIAFNGYWPEMNAALQTASFKELEVYTVLSRLPERCDRVLVVASAGNTGSAFASYCSQLNIPCLIILPGSSLQHLRLMCPPAPCVKIVALSSSSDYSDAIQLARHVAQHPRFLAEGGGKNVARRDGLATTLLSAVETIGQLPTYYFQAIGSGSGAIAVHEAAKRLLADGRFGQNLPRLMLSQNAPFAPVYKSWKSRRREFVQFSNSEGKKRIQQIVARVLSNQNPYYTIQGGIYDALSESLGDMLTADNEEALEAMTIFQELEGIDIDPEAGVTLASVFKAVRDGQIDPKESVLLNITGGGWQRRIQEGKEGFVLTEPTLQVNEHVDSLHNIISKIHALF